MDRVACQMTCFMRAWHASTVARAAHVRRASSYAQRQSAWVDRMTGSSTSPAAAGTRASRASGAAPAATTQNEHPVASTASNFNPAIADSSITPSERSDVGSVSDAAEWRDGYEGIGLRPFPPQIAQVLCEPIDKGDVEIKPDGLLYLPEIKYRRILNRAFGPGGWGLAPHGEPEITQNILSREWTLICMGRFVSTARGEQEFFKPTGVPTANEGAKSNALMRCCKDLGIASELWDPRYIRQFKAKYCVEVWCQTSDGKKYVREVYSHQETILATER